MNYTNIEQSKKLLELGLDASTADMFYSIITSITTGEEVIGRIPMLKWDNMSSLTYIPCWSVGALIDVIPESIIYHDNICHPIIDIYNKSIDYMVGGAVYKTIESDTILGAVFYNVIWLLENNYIKKKE